MTIETTVFTFKLSNTFEEWVKMFDSPEIDAFHKTVGLTPLYRGKSLIDPKEVIVIHQAEEGVAKHVFSDPETIKNIESGGHIYSTTKITSWVSDQSKSNYANLCKFNAEKEFHIRSLETKLGYSRV